MQQHEIGSRVPRGFLWGAVRAGIKQSNTADLAGAVMPRGGRAAVCYTSNRVVAAPITVGRRHLSSTGGRVSVVLVNAGNANCATGEAGLEGCAGTCVAAAQQFGCIFDEVLPSSTGIIGVPFPAEAVVRALPLLKESMGASAGDVEQFAAAILTTDTRVKMARAVITVDDAEVRLLGVAKGAGMIAPQLDLPVASQTASEAHATMLVYLFTDLLAETDELRALLAPAVQRSFNCISIDGDTSTNDTVALLASGASQIAVDARVSLAFADALDLVCGSLARQIVSDGEGVGHVVTLEISGAESEADARAVARTIANSPLCKTAWSSADPNWGRLLAAAGRSGVAFDAARVTIGIGGLPVFAEGVRHPEFDETATHEAMSEREYTITIALGMGEAACRFVTCDLTAEYVRINADYSS